MHQLYSLPTYNAFFSRTFFLRHRTTLVFSVQDNTTSAVASLGPEYPGQTIGRNQYQTKQLNA
jgi:hypothetical protein